MNGKRTVQTIAPLMGKDLRLDYALHGGFFEDADLASIRVAERAGARDLDVAAGLDTLTQALANRLKTRKGELAPLGHPDYGSRHHELIGQPNVQRTRGLVQPFVLQTLPAEPGIGKALDP